MVEERRGEESRGGKKDSSFSNLKIESSEREKEPLSDFSISDSAGKKESSLAIFGTPLSADWVPSLQLQQELSATFGMTEDNIKKRRGE